VHTVFCGLYEDIKNSGLVQRWLNLDLTWEQVKPANPAQMTLYSTRFIIRNLENP